MEALWPSPSSAAGEMIRTVCERLLADTDAVVDEIFTASVAAFSDAGMLADPSLQEENREFNRSDLVQWLTANIQHPGVRVEPYVGPRIAAYLTDLSLRRLVPDYTAGWRAALSVGWKRWIRECIDVDAPPEVLVEVLDLSAHSLVQYALDSIALLREANLATAMDHAGEEAMAMIQLITSGTAVPEHLAEERLSYRMARDHLALVLWTDRPEERQGLERATVALRSAFKGRPLLVARASITSRWVWVSGAQAADRALVEETVGEIEGVQAALGRAGHGLAGFRMSHEDALAAQAMLIRLGSDRSFTAFADVELADALTKDRASAQRFVTSTLGPLAGAEAELRQALLTYIQCGFTTTRAAARLYLHRNTVERRVARANSLAATKVEDNPVHLAAALLVLDLVPDIGRPAD